MNRRKPVKKRATKASVLRPALMQAWTEFERGFGQRDDGHTLHLSEDDRKNYIAGYNATYNTASSAPDDYTIATGAPKTVAITEEAYAELQRHLLGEQKTEGW